MARILCINSGSSSLKFALYALDRGEQLIFNGGCTRIGSQAGGFHVADGHGQSLAEQDCVVPDHAAAVRLLFDWLAAQSGDGTFDAVGHRVVHGGAQFSQPVLISADVLNTLAALIPLAPEHLPQEIGAITAVSERFPAVGQVACFDTAFHRTMPRVARHYALPSRFADAGVIRYGFHGLSYEYILSALRRTAGEQAGEGRLVIAHLGNGASMAAIRDGRCVETTMGFTPTGGLVMSTRSGDLDPGVLLFALESLGFDSASVRRLVSHQAGLLGISGVSADVSALLRAEATNERAAEALEMFCYQARKYLGGLVATLGGLETLVFTAGIGEHAPAIRAHICAGLVFLGIVLDGERNSQNAAIISHDESPVTVRVIPTNEELMIARHTAATLARTR